MGDGAPLGGAERGVAAAETVRTGVSFSSDAIAVASHVCVQKAVSAKQYTISMRPHDDTNQADVGEKSKPAVTLGALPRCRPQP